MASRYGRKKKRAHLARIAELQRESTIAVAHKNRALGEAQEAREQLRDMASEMDRWDADIAELLGDSSALLFTPRRFIESTEGWLREATILPTIGDSYTEGPEVIPSHLAFARRVDIYRFVSELSDEQRLDLKRYIRLRVAGGQNPVQSDWNYAVSAELFKRGLTERDAVYIAQQIGTIFMRRVMDELSSPQARAQRVANGAKPV